MSFDYFKLKNIKELITNSTSLQPKSPERRKFIKTMGFGLIAVNPVVKTVGALSSDSFTIEHKGNYFAVNRNGNTVWKICNSYFGENYELSVKQSKTEITIKAKNLQVIHTNFKFDLEAIISNKNSSKWELQFSIPQFNIDEKVDFINWIDGYNTIESYMSLNQNLVSLNNKDAIYLKGNFACQISHNWDFALSNKKGITTQINSKEYFSDNLLITPNQDEFDSILTSKLKNGARISIDGNFNWQQLINTINKANNYNINSASDSPNFNISLGTTSTGKTIKSLWISQKEGNLSYSEKTNPDTVLEFSNYFYLSNYSGHKTPEFFLTAKMKESEQWVSNSIGTFHVMGDEKEAELEIYGHGVQVKEHKLTPKLNSFMPKVAGAITLPTLQNNTSIQIHTAVNSATHNKKIKPIKKNQASLQTLSEGIEYAPKKPITIKVLRPEDMVFLKFEFHNFKFIGDKGISSGKTGKLGRKTEGKTGIKKPKTDGKNILIPNKRNTDIKLIKKDVKTKKSTTKNVGLVIEKKTTTTLLNFFSDDYYVGLKLDNPNKKGIVIIYFPSQHTLEEAFQKGTKPILPAKHLRAKKSRLVYELPAKHKGFDLTMNELLDWSKYKLVVDPRAWIKLDSITGKNNTYKIPNTVTKIPNNTQHLARDQKDFAVKMVLANKFIAQKNKIYELKQLNNVLYNAEVVTLKPAFNIIKNLSYTPVMGPVNNMHTAIEAPALLYISPNQTNDFLHKKRLKQEVPVKGKTTVLTNKVEFKNRFKRYSLKPLVRNIALSNNSRGTITELWHTQLGVKMKDGTTSLNLEKLQTIRALWAFDADKDPTKTSGKGDKPFKASLDAYDRHRLVHQTSNYGIKNYKPQPVQVKKLMLSNLGAYIDWHVNFKTPDSMPSLNILEWQHKAVLGRDNFVKIVEEGFLFPFGHKAVKVTITERKFNAATKAAANEQREYIIVLEDAVTYQRNDTTNKYIKFPFQEIRIKDKRTTDTYKKETLSNIDSFIIKGFKFNIVAVDKEGQEHHIKMPLSFVSKEEGVSKSKIGGIINNYHKEAYKSFTEIAFNGQKIAYSESILEGDTTLETDFLQFGAMVYSASGNTTIKFHPIMRESQVYIDAIDKMSNHRKPTKITLEDDTNDANIFASVVDAVVDFSEDSQSSGGFVTPNMVINSLSKIEGAITSKIGVMPN